MANKASPLNGTLLVLTLPGVVRKRSKLSSFITHLMVHRSEEEIKKAEEETKKSEEERKMEQERIAAEHLTQQKQAEQKAEEEVRFLHVRNALITSRRPHAELTELVKNYHTQYGPSLFEHQDDYQWTLSDWAQWSFREGDFVKAFAFNGGGFGVGGWSVNSQDAEDALLSLPGLKHKEVKRRGGTNAMRRIMLPYTCCWCAYHPAALCAFCCSKSCLCRCVQGCTYDKEHFCPCPKEACKRIYSTCKDACSQDSIVGVGISCVCLPCLCLLSDDDDSDNKMGQYQQDVLGCCYNISCFLLCGPLTVAYVEMKSGCPCVTRNCCYLPAKAEDVTVSANE